MRNPMWISLMTTIMFRVPLAYGIAYFTKFKIINGPVNLFLFHLAAWLCGAIITSIFFKLGKWKIKPLAEDK